MVTDREETTLTVLLQETEDRMDRTVREEDSRVKEDPREIAVRVEDSAREDHRAKARDARAEDRRAKEDPREITARVEDSVREDHRAKARDVQEEDSREMETVRAEDSDRADHREITVREADHRVTARVVRMETEVKDAMDDLEAVRDVRDSARIPERMRIWHLHRN